MTKHAERIMFGLAFAVAILALLFAVAELLTPARAAGVQDVDARRSGGCYLLAMTGQVRDVACNRLGRCAGTLVDGRANAARTTVRGWHWREGQRVTVKLRVCP